MKKKCNKCGEIKSLSEFHNRHTAKDGKSPICADCKNAILQAFRKANPHLDKDYYEANREKISIKAKAYHKANAGKINARRRAYRKANPNVDKDYYEANKEEFAKKSKIYRKANADAIRVSKKAYNEANADKIEAHRKVYYEANKEDIIAKTQAYYKANADKIKVRQKAYTEANSDKIKSRHKKYYQSNRKAILAQNRAYRETNIEEIKIRTKASRKKRYSSDPLYKLKVIYRGHTRRGFKMISRGKDVASLDCLGCSWKDFASHILSQFYDHPETGEKMTFENHRLHGWHLDHIEPLFNAKTKEDVIRLSHYTNFQPLWAEENLRKGSSFLDNDEQIA